jgi:hypothetical protein
MKDSDRKLLLGLLIGASAGAAAALLLDPELRSRVRAALREGLHALAGGPDGHSVKTAWRERRTERAGRTFQRRIENMRSAGL